tara:strand:+ start:229 stop:768 length:540 start_codon:yes stop_codon:yes gene_type:complete
MATFTANSIQLGTGAQFVGDANGLSNAPTGTIIQTAIGGTNNEVIVNNDGSYTDVLSLSFTPRKSNSKIIFSCMFNAYYNNSGGINNGASYQILRDSISIKEGDWCFYLHGAAYNRDFYPTVNVFGFDEPGTTNAITYKLRGRKYAGNSGLFATKFGESQRNVSALGDTVVLKLEELSV